MATLDSETLINFIVYPKTKKDYKIGGKEIWSKTLQDNNYDGKRWRNPATISQGLSSKDTIVTPSTSNESTSLDRSSPVKLQTTLDTHESPTLFHAQSIAPQNEFVNSENEKKSEKNQKNDKKVDKEEKNDDIRFRLDDYEEGDVKDIIAILKPYVGTYIDKTELELKDYLRKNDIDVSEKDAWAFGVMAVRENMTTNV